MPEFGILKKVDLRQLWSSEPSDFTPWLAQNLGALGTVLGMDLELQLREAPVGPFSLDLLVRDLESDRTVIIENQLEPTNHDHLGKLLTYAAGHDAAVAVWIAPEFREPHRQALDWLNQRTDTHTEFFGVVIEALQIDDSLPAFNFRLVAFPNTWGKQTKASASSEPSPKEQAYQTFFQDLIDRLRTQHGFTKATKAEASNVQYFGAGISGVYYTVAFAGGQARVEVYLNRDDDKSLFDALRQQKELLEAELGEALYWHRQDDKLLSRIAVYRPGQIEDDPQKLEEIKSWAIDRLLKFKQVFGTRLPGLASLAGQAVPPEPAPDEGGIPPL